MRKTRVTCSAEAQILRGKWATVKVEREREERERRERGEERREGEGEGEGEDTREAALLAAIFAVQTKL